MPREQYLSKRKDEELIRNLCVKKYYQSIIPILSKYVKGLKAGKENKYLLKKMEDIYSLLRPAIKKYVTPIFPTPEYICELWNKEKWVHNPFKQEEKNEETNRGEFVRSKSEKMIADLLYSYDYLDYVYEPGLWLNIANKIVYPDFIILNKLSGRLRVLEHAGMLGDTNYAEYFVKKHNEYISSNFVVGNNLFYTFESGGTGFNTRTIKLTINEMI